MIRLLLKPARGRFQKKSIDKRVNHYVKIFYRNLFLLLVGRTVSNLGTMILMVALPLFILDTGGTAATVGLLSFIAFLPAMIIYPFAGVIGDRCNRKSIMIFTKFGSGLVILALTILAYLGYLSLSILMAGLVVISILNGLFDPATKGILPQLVESNSLSQANAVVSSIRTLSSLAGPVIGATLYVSFGITILLTINGICFFVSGFSDILIQYKHKKIESQTTFFDELTDGFKFIAKHKEIRNLCLFLLSRVTHLKSRNGIIGKSSG